MDKLNEAEKAILEEIASGSNKLLARRAMIVLMSDTDAPAANIAREVEFTLRTVQQWQREFEKKRLSIFPDEVVNNLSAPQMESSRKPAPKDRSAKKAAPVKTKKKKAKKKRKKKKRKGKVKYPDRKEIGLLPTDTLAEAGRKVLGYHFAKMLKHEPGTRLGKDIEELHDMRVATRRMRAAFGVFGKGFSKKKTKPLLSGLKATGRALGPVRDLDVFMEKLQNHRQSLPQSDGPDGLQTLLNIWETKRAEARKLLLAYLDKKKYIKFKRNFLEFVETEGLGAKPIPQEIPPVPYQLRHIVPGLIYTAYDEVRAYETVLDNAPIETLHQLRITFKRLRYTFEFLQEILGDGKEMVIEEIKAMQDHLGDLNDADVGSTILQDFLSEWENHQLHLPLAERKSPVQIVDYLNIQINKRHHLVTTFPEVWKHFNRPEFRQTLARAISIL